MAPLRIIGQLARDARYASRLFLRRPGFTVIALVTLALGTGATTAIFTVLYNALLRPLPYPESNRLMRLERTMTTDQRGARAVGFDATFVDEMRDGRAFQSLASYGRATFTLTGAGDADSITGEVVFASYFPTLGVNASMGRVFRADEDRTPGLRPVAIVSESLWRSRLSGRQSVVGSSIYLNRVPFAILGVLPAWFKGESGDAAVWIPRMMEESVLRNDGVPYTAVLGRLRPGATPAGADAEVRRAVALMRNAARFRMAGSAVPLEESRRDPRVRGMLFALLGAVSFVVLIACVNLANLLLARGIGRQREVAVRLSLGATRAAVLRQMMTECLMLAFAGAGLGLLLAVWITNGLASFTPHDDTALWPTFLRQIDANAFHVDAAIYVFSLALAFLTTILFGVAPALEAARVDVQDTLKVDTENPSASAAAGNRHPDGVGRRPRFGTPNDVAGRPRRVRRRAGRRAADRPSGHARHADAALRNQAGRPDRARSGHPGSARNGCPGLLRPGAARGHVEPHRRDQAVSGANVTECQEASTAVR